MKKFAALGLAALFAAPAALAEPSGSWLSESQDLLKLIMQERDPSASQAKLFSASACMRQRLAPHGFPGTYAATNEQDKFLPSMRQCNSCTHHTSRLTNADNTDAQKHY